MIHAINVGETFDYSLKSDKVDPTTFILSILDSIVKTKLTDLGMVYRYNPEAPKDSVAESRMNIAEQELEFVRFGLKGFKNLKDSRGKEVVFKTEKRTLANTEYDVVSNETLKYIPKFALAELAQVIANKNELSDVEAKN